MRDKNYLELKEIVKLQELKSIGLITNDIVHSLNNAIGVMRGYADLSLRAADPADSICPYLEEIISGADSAKELVEKLRVFSRQAKPDFQRQHVQPIIKDALEASHAAHVLPVKIDQELDPACGKVLADARLIRQLAINLCRNACEAVQGGGGAVKVFLREVELEGARAAVGNDLRKGKYARFRVSDTGRGMDREVLREMFEPFFTTKKEGEGSGLGLAVVRAIVKAHNGGMIVESQLGAGTIVDVYLPLAQDEKEK